MAEGLLKYKEYTLRVIVDYPKLSFDDTLEVTVPISNNEVSNIVSGSVRLYWERDTDDCDYIALFAPDAYKKATAELEKHLAPLFGESMEVSHGADYEFLLPDEIEELIRSNPELQKEKALRKNIQEVSKKRAKEDQRVFLEEYEKGRFSDMLLLPNPKFDKTVFPGVWNAENENIAATYGFDVRISTDYEDVRIDYGKIFERDVVRLTQL